MITNPSHLIQDIHFSVDDTTETIEVSTDVAYSALYSKLQEWWVLSENHRKQPFGIFDSWVIVGRNKIHFDK